MKPFYHHILNIFSLDAGEAEKELIKRYQIRDHVTLNLILGFVGELRMTFGAKALALHGCHYRSDGVGVFNLLHPNQSELKLDDLLSAVEYFHQFEAKSNHASKDILKVYEANKDKTPVAKWLGKNLSPALFNRPTIMNLACDFVPIHDKLHRVETKLMKKFNPGTKLDYQNEMMPNYVLGFTAWHFGPRDHDKNYDIAIENKYLGTRLYSVGFVHNGLSYKFTDKAEGALLDLSRGSLKLSMKDRVKMFFGL